MSRIDSIQINVNQTQAAVSRPQVPEKAASGTTQAASGNSAKESAGAVYEKSPDTDKVITETKDGKVTEKTKTNDRSAIIKELQDNAAAQKERLLDIVRQSMTGQASTAATALAQPDQENEDSLWAKFADGKVTVTEAAKAQAQEDISEDGYWGVEKTSDRIVDFAKTLSGNDPSKAQLLMDSFKKGYEAAAKSWGKELPEISGKTFDAVNEKLQKWMDEGNAATTAAAQTTDNTIQ